MNEIEQFITHRFKQDCGWLTGNCYWFALILVNRFPQLTYYYEPIEGHFYAGDGHTYYDWRGAHNNILALKLDDIRQSDITWYNRIMRDCVK